MDIYKCPKSISLFDFWKKKTKKPTIKYIISKQLKETDYILSKNNLKPFKPFSNIF